MPTSHEPAKPVTARLTPAKLAMLDQLATHRDRDRSYLINEAIDQYLAHQTWMIERIKQAVAEADAGMFASDEEVEEFMRELSE